MPALSLLCKHTGAKYTAHDQIHYQLNVRPSAYLSLKLAVFISIGTFPHSHLTDKRTTIAGYSSKLIRTSQR